MLAMPLMCCTLTHLGMGVASKPHVLHFLLSVLPVGILSRGLWSESTKSQNFISRMSMS